MLIAEASSIKLPDGVKLIHGDFTEKLDEILEANSIPVIFSGIITVDIGDQL
jgi:hypothetical protein